MNWKERRGRFYAEGDQIGFSVLPKRNGYFVRAYLVGGAEHQLPYQDFETAKAAMDWAGDYEQKMAERLARYAQEEPIRI